MKDKLKERGIKSGDPVWLIPTPFAYFPVTQKEVVEEVKSIKKETAFLRKFFVVGDRLFKIEIENIGMIRRKK